MMASYGYFLALVLIVVAAVALFAANGVRSHGYWQDGGKLFRIYKEDGRHFLQTASEEFGTEPGKPYEVTVGVTGLTAAVPNGRITGRISMDGRRLYWNTDNTTRTWIKQRP